MHADELPPRDFQTLRPTHPGATLFGFIPWTTMEAAPMVTRAPGWARTMAKVLWRYYSDIPQRLKSRRSRFLVFGNSIAGKLKLALNQYGGEMWLSSPLKSLIRQGETVTGAVIEHEGRFIACGQVAIDDDIAGIYDMATDEQFRGQGLARTIVGALLDWAQQHGATKAFLQVNADNESALAVYRRYGFQTVYTYDYRARAGECH